MKNILTFLSFLVAAPVLAQGVQAPRSALVADPAAPAVTVLPKIAAPYTTVVNRAKVTDFSNDLLPKFGIDRVMTQQIVQVQGESGPNGEPVWKPVNDVHDAVRFVGSGWLNSIDSYGVYARSASSGDYVEYTFYGTGFNFLSDGSSGTRVWNASIDGGSAANIYPNPGGAFSAMLVSRNYNLYIPIVVASGLTPGLHTVKIANAGSGMFAQGYEIINAASAIALVPGTSYVSGQKLTKTAASTATYNSNFETGTLGTRGGHVLMYQKRDGTIGKAVTPTNASAAYLASADHTNEEVIRVYNWREFGAGRSDDYSLVSTSAARPTTFTLDDGTTTLVSSYACAQGPGDMLGVRGTSTLTFTFVGTGLDLMRADDTGGGNDQYYAYIDGGAGQAFSTTGSSALRLQKIVSGLPYGTHTIKIQSPSGPATWDFGVQQFMVYGPKTPTLPAGAVALADYFLMADYVFNATPADFHTTTSTGILSKMNSREFVYVGSGWYVNSVFPSEMSGWRIETPQTNDYVEMTFFGTGFELVASSGGLGTGVVKVKIDGSDYTGAGSVTTNGTPPVWTPGTSLLTINAGKFSVTGLTPGKHTVRFTLNSGQSFIPWSFSVITPVHAPKLNGPVVLQNTLSIGSQSIRDLRQFSQSVVPAQKAVAQAVGINGSVAGTTSASLIPMNDLAFSIKTSGCPLEISYSTSFSGSGASGYVESDSQIYVDGVAQGSAKQSAFGWGSSQAPYWVSSDSVIVPVSVGYHHVAEYWSGAGSSAVIPRSTLRNLKAREICN